MAAKLVLPYTIHGINKGHNFCGNQFHSISIQSILISRNPVGAYLSKGNDRDVWRSIYNYQKLTALKGSDDHQIVN